MCSGVTPPKIAEYKDYMGMEGSPALPRYVEPTVIEILEAANGLRDPETLGLARGRYYTPEFIEILKLQTPLGRSKTVGSLDPDEPFRR